MSNERLKNQRYGRAIIRNLHELLRSLSYRNAYNGLCMIVPETNWSFFSYASLVLYDGIFSHTIKVLDKHRDAASFFYLYNCNSKAIEVELIKNGLNFTEINTLADKLYKVLDKTHFHIDKQAVFSPDTVWTDADITSNFLNRITDKLWLVLNSIYTSHFGREFGQPIYDAHDIKDIIEAVKSKWIAV